MILNMKKMAKIEINHPLEKMKMLGVNDNLNMMEMMVMTFQMEKLVMIGKTRMIVITPHLVMMEKK